MPREIVEIPLCELSVSKLNVRRHGGKDVASLARSIKEKATALFDKGSAEFDIVAEEVSDDIKKVSGLVMNDRAS